MVQDCAVIWPATNWLLSQESQLSVKSLKTYANQLLEFYRQLEADDLTICEVNTSYFKGYEQLLRKRKVGSNYIAQVFSTVLRYLKWVQDEGLVSGLIGETKDHRIVVASSIRGRHPLIPKVNKKSSVSRMPSRSDIEITNSHLPRVDECLRLRDELIMDWGVLRASEIACIPLSEIPTASAITTMLHTGQTTIVTIPVSKGGGEYPLEVHPELLNRTRQWADLDRPRILRAARKRAKRSGVGFVEPPELFVSTRGKAIGSRTISNTIRNGCKAAIKAGDLAADVRVWVHGLRHRELTHDYQSRVDAGQRGAEEMTKRRANHKTLKSTDVYIHLVQRQRNPIRDQEHMSGEDHD